MATLTIPHHRFQSCRELRKAVSEAWRMVKSGKGWQSARDRLSWLGDIRALEVTHGDNGWHPHLHVLVFFQIGAPASSIRLFGEWLFDAWARAVSRLGLGECNAGAFTWEPTREGNGAADYVGKWGAALELTKAHTKRGRSGRTPWQILADFAATGNHRDRVLFREYAAAFFGARQLTWSRALRPLYLHTPEASDAELAQDTDIPGTQIAAMDRQIFQAVASRGRTAHLLCGLESGGLPAVLHTLTQLQIPWSLIEVPGFEPGTFVPCISPGAPGNTTRGVSRDTFPTRRNKGFHAHRAALGNGVSNESPQS